VPRAKERDRAERGGQGSRRARRGPGRGAPSAKGRDAPSAEGRDAPSAEGRDAPSAEGRERGMRERTDRWQGRRQWGQAQAVAQLVTAVGGGRGGRRRDGVRAECGGAHASMHPAPTFRSHSTAAAIFRTRPPAPTSRSRPPAPTSRSRSPTAATLRSRLPHAHVCFCAWAQCAVSMDADCERRRRRQWRR